MTSLEAFSAVASRRQIKHKTAAMLANALLDDMDELRLDELGQH